MHQDTRFESNCAFGLCALGFGVVGLRFGFRFSGLGLIRVYKTYESCTDTYFGRRCCGFRVEGLGAGDSRFGVRPAGTQKLEIRYP